MSLSVAELQPVLHDLVFSLLQDPEAALDDFADLAGELLRLARVLHRRCHVRSRKVTPSTLGRLGELDPECQQLQQAA
jgi:hypothetical protein